MRVQAFVSGVLLLAGCQAVGGSPHLIELSELTPRTLGPGDRLELHGRGFPEGRRARITFRGELARAGQPAERGVEISTFADTSSPHTLTFELDRRIEHEFCAGESAQHTTFHGSVEAAFAPRNAGAPPVTGEIFDVSLDIVPQASLEQLEARAREGERFADFLGALIERDPRGLLVKGVMPRSRAESAGLSAGDLLIELDGVRVLGPGDFVPQTSATRSRLLVQRLQSSEPVALIVESSGFRPKSLQELIPALALLALAATLALLLRSPLGRAVTWLERRVVQRARQPRTNGLPRSQGLLAALSHELPLSVGPYFSIVLAAAAFSAIAMGRELVAAELDLPITMAAALLALVVAGLLDPGRPKTPFGQRLRLSGGVALQQLTLGLALGAAALTAESVRPFDLVARQGALPWTYGAFESPVSLLAFVTFVAALVPRACRQSELALVPARTAGPLLACAEWAALMVSCSLGALVFLGGYRLPGVPLAPASLVLQALGALLLCSKALGLLGLVLGLRSVIGRVDAAQAWPVTLRWLLPTALISLVLSAAWLHFGKSTGLAGAESALGYASFGGFCLLCLLFAQRITLELRRSSYEPSVSPWL
ncbi:MAG TPA: NADH-quinone oxidoreductase subunit H [Polyangiaceae bacterium]|nr:NADH-quinone oxidoreductase subunit H [Polyangiaceae bacterium]